MAEQASIVLVLDELDRLAMELVAITNAAINEVGGGVLSLPQWRLLVVLGSEAAPLRLAEVAKRINASLPSASRLLDRLERRGLVSSERDAADRRGRLSTLTSDGQELRRTVIARRRALLEESVVDLMSDAELAASLGVIVNRLSHWL